MARKPRMEYEGAFYHVMARGDRRQEIFGDDEDRRLFVDLMGQVCARTGWKVHSWVLMGNHYHWLLETPEANLVAGMKWLMGVYTQKFNRRHRICGHLFQGRYKAIPIQEGDYLLRVSDYIHLNPVRAGLLDREKPRLESYAWSSFAVWVGGKAKPPWCPFEQILGWCGLERNQRGLYIRRMRRLTALALEEEMDWSDVRQGWALGDDGFLEEMAEEAGRWMSRGTRRESYQGEAAQSHDLRRAEQMLERGLVRLQIDRGELGRMAKTDARKKALVWWIKSQTIAEAGWLAERLSMGHRVNASVTQIDAEMKPWIEILKSSD